MLTCKPCAFKNFSSNVSEIFHILFLVLAFPTFSDEFTTPTAVQPWINLVGEDYWLHNISSGISGALSI
jgi:hypothetical protein